MQKSRIGELWQEIHSCVFKVGIYLDIKVFWMARYKKVLKSVLDKNHRFLISYPSCQNWEITVEFKLIKNKQTKKPRRLWTRNSSLYLILLKIQGKRAKREMCNRPTRCKMENKKDRLLFRTNSFDSLKWTKDHDGCVFLSAREEWLVVKFGIWLMLNANKI